MIAILIEPVDIKNLDVRIPFIAYLNNSALFNECAKLNKVSSLNELPAIWNPIGNLSFVVPAGILREGVPIKLNGTVNMSARYILIGSSKWFFNGNAIVAVVGINKQSTFKNSLLYSFFITLRTFNAFE